jgi:hypothetical protein
MEQKIWYFETKLVGFLKFFSNNLIKTLLIMLINFNKHNKLTDLKGRLCSGIGCEASIKILDFFHLLNGNYDPLPIFLRIRMRTRPRPKT